MKTLTSLPLILLFAYALPQFGYAHDHEHEHGATCSGDHAQEVEAHDHEHEHEHGATCSGDHAHEVEAHEHKHEYEHEHGATCSGDHAQEVEAHERKHEHEHEHGATCSGDHTHEMPALRAVVVPESAQRIIGLKTVAATPRQLHAMRRLIGRYEPLPEARQTIASPITGRLTLLVRSLDRVAKGDALCTIASPELTARAAEIALLQKRLTIYRDLQTPNAALETELAVKQAEYKALLLDAEEKEGAVVLRASCAGQVDAFDVESGAWVEAGAPVLRLIQPQALRFKALIPATEAQTLQDRLHVHVEEAHGELRLGIGSENGLTPVYIYFETAPKSARVGAKADVICTMESHETPRLSVPSSAIITVNLQPSVFMRDPHDATRFICVPVTPGLSAAGWTAVEGLPSPTTEVVTDGAYELKLALPGNAQKPAGHFHADGVYHEGEH